MEYITLRLTISEAIQDICWVKLVHGLQNCTVSFSIQKEQVSFGSKWYTLILLKFFEYKEFLFSYIELKIISLKKLYLSERYWFFA